jgi:hypothetical protein
MYYIENFFPGVSTLYGTFQYLWTTPQFYFLTLIEILAVFFYQKCRSQIIAIRNRIRNSRRSRKNSLSKFLEKQKEKM